MKMLPIILIGAGGHSKVLIDILRLRSFDILGMVDVNPDKWGSDLMGVSVIGSDTELLRHSPEEIRVVNGIGTIRTGGQRRRVFEEYKSKDYEFETVVHPTATLSQDASLEEGCQIMAGAIVQAGCRIGMNSIVNTGALIDHDSSIGAHVHIAPGVVLSGGVVIGDGAHIGTGAVIIQGIHIGKNSLVAAGATVIRDVPDNVTVAGIPARELLR